MLAFKMVPIIGFELMTYRLQGGCNESKARKEKTSHRKAMLAFKMVPIIGFELMTYRLQGGCSTN